MRDAGRGSPARNVLGGELLACCASPPTGFYRDGYCHTGPTDAGSHTVCVRITQEFLDFSRAHGNDLTTARPEYQFPGLKAGDRWCVCVARWKEAADAGAAPPVWLLATHERALDVVTLAELSRHAADFQ